MNVAGADWRSVVDLVNAQRLDEAQSLIEVLLKKSPADPNVLYATAFYLLVSNNLEPAADLLRTVLSLDPDHISARIYLAILVRRTGQHAQLAECRDILRQVILQHPNIVAEHELGMAALDNLAECSRLVGPFDEAVRFGSMLAEARGTADDFFHLSESLAIVDRLEDAEAAMRRAVKLDPAKYGQAKHAQTLDIIESVKSQTVTRQRVRKHRYPTTDAFKGDLGELIRDHIATEHKHSPRFITKDTVFFTMGSCFARNIGSALRGAGFDTVYMEISEFINTTFANRGFVDWLEDKLPDQSVRERIEELLPPEFTREKTIEQIRRTDVFILTLGVAPAFFERNTGEFVMPRSTHLNMRALAEKYVNRTTTVAENVDNVLYLLNYIRKLSPKCKIVVTVSPVPILVTFEFDSAVVADCLSKSTMRLTAHEVVNNSGLDDIYYWPSFEIFRWAGSNAGPFYGTDDGAAWHVSSAAVNTTVAAFVDMLSAQ